MLEPLAASVFSSVFSVCPSSAKASTSRSALKTLRCASSSSFPADFFTPRPRGLKGKERAIGNERVVRDFLRKGKESCHHGSVAESSSILGSMPSSSGASCSRQRLRTTRRTTVKPLRSPAHTQLPVTSVRHKNLSQHRYMSTGPVSPPMPVDPHPPRILNSTQPPDVWILQIVALRDVAPTELLLSRAWHAYSSLRSTGQQHLLTLDEAMVFCNSIGAFAHRCLPEVRHDVWNLWGERVLTILQDVDHRIGSSDLDEYRQTWYGQRARALAFAGSLDEAKSLLRVISRERLEPEHRGFVLTTYDMVLQCLLHYNGPEAVLESLLDNWAFINIYLLNQTNAPRFKIRHILRAFRSAVHNAIGSIENPLDVLLHFDTRSRKDTMHAGMILIEALCVKNLAFDAYSVMKMMEQHKYTLPRHQILTVIKSLAKAEQFELANKRFVKLSQQWVGTPAEVEIFHVGLYIFSQQGDAARVAEYAKKLESREIIEYDHVSLMIHVHAVRGDPVSAVEVFEKYFDSPRNWKPDMVHFTSVIHAFSKTGDHDGVNSWLEKMIQAGYLPDEYVFNVILQCFSLRGEIASVGAILDQMRASGVAPSHITYTSVIAMLGRRKDSLAAEHIFKRALNDGIVPTNFMLNALLNAHVEAGSWEGVVRTFDYLKWVARKRGVSLSISSYNILMKAYILAGAPFKTVLNVFHGLQELDITPDGHTYSLVIQSACDSGLMKTAEDLFAEMKAHARDWKSHVSINVYVLTILMAGYLRMGLKARAKAVYDDMVLRGIAPTAHTFQHILNAYSNPKSRRTLAVAEDFIKSVTVAEANNPQWSTTMQSVRKGLPHLYAPLLRAYTERGDKADVERHLQAMIDSGGAPSIANLTILLDLYRRKKDIEAVKRIWPQIHDLALQESDVDALFVDDEANRRPRRQANILCVPFSIYIDALSAAGEHMEIPLVWRQLSVEGFTFDAHNWNHLVVALVRASEVERAFEVIERVIIPYRMLTKKLTTWDPKPDSPLVTDIPREGAPERGPSQPPLEGGRRRSDYVKVYTERSKASPPILNLTDFTHPLHVLHQVSPGWNDWRPHGVVLVLLHRVLQHLESGRRVEPVGGPTKDPTTEMTLTEDEMEERARKSEPREILKRIHEKCPHTTRAIFEYRKFCEEARGARRAAKATRYGMQLYSNMRKKRVNSTAA